MSLINPQTLSEQIYQVLREDIIQQRLAGGEKLTLRSLQHRFQVSSTPIREALSRLTQEGLVHYCSNIGITVIQLGDQDARELFQFKADLDCLAMQYAYQGSSRKLMLSDLENALHHALFYVEKEDMTAARWSDEFHLIFYRYCGNSRLQEVSDNINNQISILTVTYNNKQDMMEQLYHGHLAIYQALAQDRPEEACRLMRKHLENSLQYVLGHIQP